MRNCGLAVTCVATDLACKSRRVVVHELCGISRVAALEQLGFKRLAPIAKSLTRNGAVFVYR